MSTRNCQFSTHEVLDGEATWTIDDALDDDVIDYVVGAEGPSPPLPSRPLSDRVLLWTPAGGPRSYAMTTAIRGLRPDGNTGVAQIALPTVAADSSALLLFGGVGARRGYGACCLNQLLIAYVLHRHHPAVLCLHAMHEDVITTPPPFDSAAGPRIAPFREVGTLTSIYPQSVACLDGHGRAFWAPSLPTTTMLVDPQRYCPGALRPWRQSLLRHVFSPAANNL